MRDTGHDRQHLVEAQIAARGIRDPRVLAAIGEVPREAFLPPALAEFAADDTALPLPGGEVTAPPYIVALLAAAVNLGAGERVLEIGTGSGYGTAALSRMAGAVYTVERDQALALSARDHFWQLGYDNIQVLVGDGSLGWADHAPYDAIVVTTPLGPDVPPALLQQLAIGGRLVFPLSDGPRELPLLRVTRVSEGSFQRESLGEARFVPLSKEERQLEPPPTPVLLRASNGAGGASVVRVVREAAERFTDLEEADLGGLLERIGDARVVLVGEASHGTAEFYRMRARLTRELIRQKGFNLIALEADWPDAAKVDRFVRHLAFQPNGGPAFTRFPTWMWRNREVDEFVGWLRAWNQEIVDREDRVSVHGLDLYSLFASIEAVLRYLDDVDPDAARVARHRYGCLTPWEREPARYGEAALTGRYRLCEPQVVAMLSDLLRRRLDYAEQDGERFIDAVQNARLVANAERYYRVMYYGSVESWNLRDSHMFDTLKMLLATRGHRARAVVWEHNSHVGDAAATEMGARGEHNVGHLCRRAYGARARLIGFGTDHGAVAAASEWDGPMEIKAVRPAHPASYERLFHETGIPGFLLSLREPARAEVRGELESPRLERAIGVIYRPETELQSHYFQACLPRQFDEYIWLDETGPVTPLEVAATAGVPDTYPFGL
jgi:protein-L-isoaspartate(D-aspartate) O-methyltransferase